MKISFPYRRAVSILTFLILLSQNISPVSAAILFQNDDFSIDRSQGFIFNSDDGGDEDVTLRIGNDGTDGTVIWDDGLSELQFGDGIDNVSVNSASWDISSAGVGSGFTGFTSTGTVNFSGAGAFRLRENTDPAANSACATIGELIYDTTDQQIQKCTATGGAGAATWSNIDTTGGSSDFEAVYTNDADDTLTTSNGNFTIASGTGDTIIDSNDWNVTAAGALDAASVASNGALTATGTASLNGVANIGDGGDDININSNDWDISSAGVGSGFTGFSSSGTVSSTGTLSASGVFNASGSTQFRLRENSDPNTNSACASIGELIFNTTSNQLMRCTTTGTPGVWTNVDTTGGSSDFEAVYTNDADDTLTTSNGNFTVSSGTGDTIIDSNDWNVTAAGALDAASITSNGALTATGTTSLNGIANIGDGGDDVAINSNDWDISSAGVGSGFTGFSSSGTIDFSSSTSFRVHEAASDPGTCTEGQVFFNTTSNQLKVCATTNTWVSATEPTDDLSIYLNPEFEDAVLSADGSNNNGTLTADRDGANFRNFYQWNVNVTTLQDFDVVASVTLPDDFSSFQATPIQLHYRTDDADVADAQIDVIVLDTANAAVTTSGATDLNSTTWATASITFSGTPTFSAGQRITIAMKLQARKDGGGGGGAARSAFIGPLILNYNRR